MTLPNTQQEQVITSLLKNKIEESSGSSNIQLELSTKGSKQRVLVNPRQKNEVVFSHESLDKLQSYLNNSNRHMRGIAQWIRTNVGRKAIEPEYATHITE